MVAREAEAFVGGDSRLVGRGDLQVAVPGALPCRPVTERDDHLGRPPLAPFVLAGPDGRHTEPVAAEVAAGDRDHAASRVAMIMDRGEGSWRISVQDHPQQCRVGGVGPAELVGLPPVGVQGLVHLDAIVKRPIAEQFAEPDGQHVSRYVGVDPAGCAERPIGIRAGDHLGHRCDAVPRGVRDDPIRGIGDRQARIAHREAGVGAAGETAGGPQRPLTEWLVDGQPARQGMAFQSLRADAARMRAARSGRNAAGRHDRGPLDHLGRTADDAEPDRRGVHGLQPADHVRGRAVRQAVANHPSIPEPGIVGRDVRRHLDLPLVG